jgi:hypothetical protein
MRTGGFRGTEPAVGILVSVGSPDALSSTIRGLVLRVVPSGQMPPNQGAFTAGGMGMTKRVEIRLAVKTGGGSWSFLGWSEVLIWNLGLMYCIGL